MDARHKAGHDGVWRNVVAIMRIVDIRETAIPLKSSLRNSSFDFSEMTTSVVFVSKAALRGGLRNKLGVDKQFVAVDNTRKITKKSMVHNGATPDIKVDPETYEVTADGELLTCEPAEVLPMAQRYFLF